MPVSTSLSVLTSAPAELVPRNAAPQGWAGGETGANWGPNWKKSAEPQGWAGGEKGANWGPSWKRSADADAEPQGFAGG